jgi:hypothetical protein
MLGTCGAGITTASDLAQGCAEPHAPALAEIVDAG